MRQMRLSDDRRPPAHAEPRSRKCRRPRPHGATRRNPRRRSRAAFCSTPPARSHAGSRSAREGRAPRPALPRHRPRLGRRAGGRDASRGSCGTQSATRPQPPAGGRSPLRERRSVEGDARQGSEAQRWGPFGPDTPARAGGALARETRRKAESIAFPYARGNAATGRVPLVPQGARIRDTGPVTSGRNCRPGLRASRINPPRRPPPRMPRRHRGATPSFASPHGPPADPGPRAR